VRDQASLLIRPAAAADLQKILDLYAQPDFDDGNVLPLETARQLSIASAITPTTRSIWPSAAARSSAASPCW